MKYSNAIYIYGIFDREITSIRANISGIEGVSFIPISPDNTYYKEIMALVESGELTIAPAEKTKANTG